MPDVPQLAKAELRQLDADFKNEINKDKWTIVQFNPDSLKVSFANQVAAPSGSSACAWWWPRAARYGSSARST